MIQHTFGPNDTISGILKRYNGHPTGWVLRWLQREFDRLNGQQVFRIGDTVTIPIWGVIPHIWQEGDTVESVIRQYHPTVTDISELILKASTFQNTQTIPVGSWFMVPAY